MRCPAWLLCAVVPALGLMAPDLAEAAPPVDDSAYENIGMGGSGGIFAPGASPVDPDFMLTCSDMTGCYRSYDGGRIWRMINFTQINGATGCKPFFHTRDVNIVLWRNMISRDKAKTFKELGKGKIYAYMVSHAALSSHADPSVYIGTMQGLYGSDDGGKSFAVLLKGKCGGIAVLNDDRVFAVVDGKLYAWVARESQPSPSLTDGVPGPLRSQMGGSSVAIGAAGDGLTLHVLAADGLYTSNDSGKTWRLSLPNEKSGAIVDVVMATNQTKVAHARNATKVFVTADGGRTWRNCFDMSRNVERSWVQTEIGWGYVMTQNGLNVCPSNSDLVMMSTQGDFYISRDGGGHWQQAINRQVGDAPDGARGGRYQGIGLEVTTTWDYLFDPWEPNRHYIAYTDCGFARSTDAGKTWSYAAWGCPWANTFYEVDFDPFEKGKMYAACSSKHDIPQWMHINSDYRPGGVCISRDFGATWNPVRNWVPEMPCTGIAVDRKSSKPGAVVVYAAVYGVGVYKSSDGGATWHKRLGVGHFGNYHLYQIRCHPKTGDVYVNVTANRIGNSGFPVPGGLWRSSNGGETWTELTADLKLQWANGFSVHPENPDIIYLAAACTTNAGQGGLYKTVDGGKAWEHVLKPSDLPPGYAVGTFVELHPDKPEVVYYGGSTGLHVSPDGGKTWRRVLEIPFENVHRVRIDPGNKGTMYVTTFGGGVWRGPTVMK